MRSDDEMRVRRADIVAEDVADLVHPNILETDLLKDALQFLPARFFLE